MKILSKLNNIDKKLILRFYKDILKKDYMPVLGGDIKGYLWPIKSNYNFIYGDYVDKEVLKWLDTSLKSDSVFL